MSGSFKQIVSALFTFEFPCYKCVTATHINTRKSTSKIWTQTLDPDPEKPGP